MHATATSIGGQADTCRAMRLRIQALIDLSTRLHAALLHREIETAWAVLAEQERLVGNLHRDLQLWEEIFAELESPDVALRNDRAALREEIRQLQALSRENAALSRSFSGAIRKALSGLGRPVTPRATVYDSLGKVAACRRSLFVNQTG